MPVSVSDLQSSLCACDTHSKVSVILSLLATRVALPQVLKLVKPLSLDRTLEIESLRVWVLVREVTLGPKTPQI